jgi:hypothetical protein
MVNPFSGAPIAGMSAATQAQLAAEFSGNTEQALVELVYVQAANNMLGDQMGLLGSAINTSQSVLNLLNWMQDFHNAISINSPASFNFDYLTGNSAGAAAATDENAYEAAYDTAASAYYGKGVTPVFTYSTVNAAGYQSFFLNFQSTRAALSAEFLVLGEQTVSTQRGPGTLFAYLQKILGELPSVAGATATNTAVFSALKTWTLDNYSAVGSGAAQAGTFQNDLTSAITAAQSLNNTQQEQVRNFLFVFQEYYQSASAVLSSMTQIIQDMAQKISG